MSTQTQTSSVPLSLTVTEGPLEREVLTEPARAFLATLAARFEAGRRELLARRAVRQQELRDGRPLDFLHETADIRAGDWCVAPIPDDVADRRVEITGPVDRKMIINALNSGANVFMADFEDSNSPTWRNNLEGQLNLRDAVRETIEYKSPEGKQYRLNGNAAVLFVRPRGWHLVEKHVRVGQDAISASLFDFGLFLFHNGATLLERGRRPYFYAPKLESHLEARLWNDVFRFSQEYLGIPQGSIRATVLIETIPAAFEMDEILYELRDHSAGLNCGRWDYIFSFIKKFAHRADWVLPDRAQVTMDRHFLKSYVDLLIHTCHRRGIHAMGGMAAQIPIKSDPTANERALERVRQDKLREVRAGHDGTWVAHPGLVPVARAVFDQYMTTPHQIARLRDDVKVSPTDLLTVPEGHVTQGGLETNIDVGIQYLEAWLGGNGCVPIYNLMEDAATAEISRAQLWQWSHHHTRMADGSALSTERVVATIRQVLEKTRERTGAERFDRGHFPLAAKLFEQMTCSPEFPEFLTLAAYEHID